MFQTAASLTSLYCFILLGLVAWADVCLPRIQMIPNVAPVRQHSFMEIGHEIISKAILSPPLI